MVLIESDLLLKHKFHTHLPWRDPFFALGSHDFLSTLLTDIELIHCDLKWFCWLQKPQRAFVSPRRPANRFLLHYTLKVYGAWGFRKISHDVVLHYYFRFLFFLLFTQFWLWFVFDFVYLVKNIAAPLTLKSFVNNFVIAEIKLMLFFICWLFGINMFVNRNFSTFNYFQPVFRPELLMII